VSLIFGSLRGAEANTTRDRLLPGEVLSHGLELINA